MNYTYVNSIKYGCGDGHREVEVLPQLRERMARDNQPMLFLPKGDDARFSFLQPNIQDPAPGVKKFFTVNDKVDIEDTETAFLFLLHNTDRLIFGLWNDSTVKTRLAEIHQSLHLQHGNLEEEVPEQILLTSFLPVLLNGLTDQQDLNVLEIGGNMGRATMVTRRVLTSLFGVLEEKPVIRHAVMETFPSIAAKLRDNLAFQQMSHEIQVVESTLNDESRFGLIQTNWNITSFDLSNEQQRFSFDKELRACRDRNNREYKTQVKSIHFQQLRDTYFDGHAPNVWIVDCEGFFYNIVQQFPECLEDLQLLVIENDFSSLEQKRVVDAALRAQGLYDLVTFPGGLPSHACKAAFYQIWVRRASVVERLLARNMTLCYYYRQPDRFPEFEIVHLSTADFRADSKLSTNPSMEKKQNSPEFMSTPIDFADLPVDQEFDFCRVDEQTFATREHDFVVYSIIGCTRCDKLMYDASSLLNEMREFPEASFSVRVRKVDVTEYVRNNPAGKEQFGKFLHDEFGYKADPSSTPTKPHDQRMYFPIVVYNHKYLGGAEPASRKLSKTVGELLEQLEDASSRG